MIELVFFRVREVELKQLPPDSVPTERENAMMQLGRVVEINPKDNKRARIFLRSEMVFPQVKLVLVSETRFRNPDGFTSESINSDETLKELINMFWPQHLEAIKFLSEKAGYQIKGLPEKIDKLEG